MALGVSYDIKHSGSFLYKLSNEKDGLNFEISRIALPQQLNANFLIEEGQKKIGEPKEGEKMTVIRPGLKGEEI